MTSLSPGVPPASPPSRRSATLREGLRQRGRRRLPGLHQGRPKAALSLLSIPHTTWTRGLFCAVRGCSRRLPPRVETQQSARRKVARAYPTRALTPGLDRRRSRESGRRAPRPVRVSTGAAGSAGRSRALPPGFLAASPGRGAAARRGKTRFARVGEQAPGSRRGFQEAGGYARRARRGLFAALLPKPRCFLPNRQGLPPPLLAAAVEGVDADAPSPLPSPLSAARRTAVCRRS